MLEIQSTTMSQGKGPVNVNIHLSVASKSCSHPESSQGGWFLCSQGLWGWQVKKISLGQESDWIQLGSCCLPVTHSGLQVTAPVPISQTHICESITSTYVQWVLMVEFNMDSNIWAEGKRREPNSLGDFVNLQRLIETCDVIKKLSRLSFIWKSLKRDTGSRGRKNWAASGREKGAVKWYWPKVSTFSY